MRRLVILAFLLAACFRPILPPMVVPSTLIFPPPDLYRQWYREAERCSGLKGKFTGLQWYAVHSRGFYLPGDTSKTPVELIGLYHQDPLRGRQIYMVHHYLLVRELVVHESLHDLMALNGLIPGHPDSLFRAKCKLR